MLKLRGGKWGPSFSHRVEPFTSTSDDTPVFDTYRENPANRFFWRIFSLKFELKAFGDPIALQNVNKRLENETRFYVFAVLAFLYLYLTLTYIYDNNIYDNPVVQTLFN